MKKIRIDFQKDGVGIGYRIDPETQTYSSAALKDGELSGEVKNGEYADPQKFASQLYYMILASMNEKEQKPAQEI